MIKLTLLTILILTISSCKTIVGSSDFCNMYNPLPKLNVSACDVEKFEAQNIDFFYYLQQNNLIQKDLCFAEYGYLLPK